MFSGKKRRLKNILDSSIGCGCGPGPKANPNIIQPKPISKFLVSDYNRPSRGPSSSSSSWDRHGGEECSSTTFSYNIDHPEIQDDNGSKCSNTISPCPKITGSFAVVKESDDPYRDFRQSMLQMIIEKEIYSREDLQQLLDCFLELNSPHHRETIVRAFLEIWNGGAESDGGPTSRQQV